RSAEAPFLQVLGEQVVVGLGGRLDQLLAVLLGPVPGLAWNLALGRLAASERDRLHLDEIDEAPEARLLPERDVQSDQPTLEPPAERVDGAEEVGALAVEAVDHPHAPQRVFPREISDPLRLPPGTRHPAGRPHGPPPDPQPGPRVGDKIAVPGSVNQIDSMSFPITICN